jgi:transposase
MLNLEQINEIHRLAGGEHWSMRRIAHQLRLAARTVKKYLATPVPSPVRRPRPSKLDPFKPLMRELLEQDPHAPGAVILQRLQAAGYSGGHTILRDHLQRVRVSHLAPRAFLRMEPGPGERFEIDWGHFGALDYQGDKRKLYAFCLIEAHSRMLYVEFTHSQNFETFLRCHQHAFAALHGVSRECWYDNLLTAVAEHDGRLVRFQPRFLAFAREYGFYPQACNPGAGWEKGKVEKGGVAYLRSNFWPLRSFSAPTCSASGWFYTRWPRGGGRSQATRPAPSSTPSSTAPRSRRYDSIPNCRRSWSGSSTRRWKRTATFATSTPQTCERTWFASRATRIQVGRQRWRQVYPAMLKATAEGRLYVAGR